jgi:hypothetical protein
MKCGITQLFLIYHAQFPARKKDLRRSRDNACHGKAALLQ